MANYTAELRNPSSEPDSRSTFVDEEGQSQTALERAIQWCELQVAQHVPPNYPAGWTAVVFDDSTQAQVWPE